MLLKHHAGWLRAIAATPTDRSLLAALFIIARFVWFSPRQ